MFTELKCAVLSFHNVVRRELVKAAHMYIMTSRFQYCLHFAKTKVKLTRNASV